MTLEPLNPYKIIEQLTQEVSELKKENEELKKLIPTSEEEENE